MKWDFRVRSQFCHASLSPALEGLEMSIFSLLCEFIPGQLYVYSSPGLWTIVRAVGLAYIFIQKRLKSKLYNFSNVLFCLYNKLLRLEVRTNSASVLFSHVMTKWLHQTKRIAHRLIIVDARYHSLLF